MLAALLSTSSTKGLLTFVIIAVVNYITKREYKQKIYQVIKFLLSAFLLVGGVFACVYILQDKSQTGSFGVRMDDIHAAIITWKNKPLFGVGYAKNCDILSGFKKFRWPEYGIDCVVGARWLVFDRVICGCNGLCNSVCFTIST